MADILPGRIIDSVNGQTGVVFIQEDKYYVHEQNLPSSSWTVEHNLNKKPAITILDSAETEVEGQVQHINNNMVTITFNGSFSGKAIFN